MLTTLLAWIIISIICWTWGNAILVFSFYKPHIEKLHFSIVCLTGLSVLTIFNCYISLLTNLSSLIILALTILAVLFLTRRNKAKELKKNFLNSLPSGFSFLLLLIVSSLLVLVMSIWHIDHPDTVEYHAAIIKSIKEKGIITGYANENIRFGLQSNWFIACALFNFDFFSPGILTFINSIVLFWAMLFVIKHISDYFNGRQYGFAFLLLFFFAIAFFDYTQIRLTTTSASPDFIAAIFILLTFYFFMQRQQTTENYFLTLLFAVTAITIKLSSFVIGLLLLYILLTSRKTKNTVLAILFLFISLTPFLLRNYFTSGYAFFPTTFFQLGSPHWQITGNDVHDLQRYITAYAKNASPAEDEAVKSTLNLPLRNWLLTWWDLRSHGQKALLLITITTFFFGMVHLKKILQSTGNRHRVSLLITLVGLISWFLLAPDPRFGTAWLFLLNALILPLAFPQKIGQRMNAKIVNASAYLFGVCLCIYLSYRFVIFFDAYNLLFPYGLV